MLTTNLHYTMAMIWVLVIANVIATSMSLGASSWFAKVSLLPFYVIVPLTLVLCASSSFAANYTWADLITFLVFSTVGYFMKLFGWAIATTVAATTKVAAPAAAGRGCARQSA